MLSTPKAKAELFLASSLYDGLEDNNIMQVTTLLLNKEADPNVLIPSQGITPFHLVIGNESETFAEEVTKLFLRHGGNPNVKSVDGMTPVHVAAAWGRLGVLELLLANGGDPLLVDDDGRSPFHYAFEEAHYDAVATLGKYCGESFEEDSDPKYNIALDKILLSNGGVLAEYAVSEDTSSTSIGNVPTIHTTKISNNNNGLLKNLNQQFGDLAVTKKQAEYAANVDVSLTTTADESSILLPKSVNVRQDRKCLPRKNLKHMEKKLKNKDTLEQAERDLPKENIPPLDNRLSISHLNDPMIEGSFLVEPQKVGENMPRISSPKCNKEFIKSDPILEYRNNKSTITTPQENKKAINKNKFVHKTPLRYCSKKQLLAEIKKTPTPTSARKVSNLNGKITPSNAKLSANDHRASNYTPSKYILSKQSSYSPDCSIISRSPNLIHTPITPTSNCKSREAKQKISRAGTQSASNLKRIPMFGGNNKTPKSDNICNKGNSEKNLSRFVKQSNLMHQDTKKTPTYSPSRFRESPTLSKKSLRIRNLTDSSKRKNKFSTGKTKTALTPTYFRARSPTTPHNKTYNKKEYFGAAGMSPDTEIPDRFVNRRNVPKNIAIKLEDTMYDDDCDECLPREIEIHSKTPRTITQVKSSAKAVIHTLSTRTMEPDMSNFADNQLNYLNNRISSNPFTYNKCFQISGINTMTDSEKLSEGEGTSFRSLESHKDAQGSNMIAGCFQLGDINCCSFKTRNNSELINDFIVPRISKPYPTILVSNFAKLKNPVSSTTDENIRSDGPHSIAACPKLPDSKRIDESLISSECSNYSLDNNTKAATCSSSFNETDLSIKQEESIKIQADLGEDASDSESYLSLVTADGHPTNGRKTCSIFPNVSSSTDNSSYASFVSVEEEYKYEDAEEGVILMERRLLITPVSIPMIKPEDKDPPGESSQCVEDESMESCISSLPHSLVIMDSETLRKELTKLDCHPPGPITASTRHVYLKRLRKLQKHCPFPPSTTISVQPKFSMEIERTLRSDSWMNDLSMYDVLEQQVFSEFSKPDPTRRWREGKIKSSFNYLLMDPRITNNLPRRADTLLLIDRWRIFLSSIFYVGKGRRSRPYAHLYEAYGEWKKGKRDTSDKKINCILDIWKSSCGVVCLHIFQNTIPVEAYTREAAMIEALGLERLKNSKLGDYYGVAATWSHHQKRTLGVYLLYKAMHILINEGERQLSPDDIGR